MWWILLYVVIVIIGIFFLFGLTLAVIYSVKKGIITLKWPSGKPAGGGTPPNGARWYKSEYIIRPFQLAMAIVIIILICLITKPHWVTNVFSYGTAWLITFIAIGSAALWPFKKELGWLTALIVLGGGLYAWRTNDGNTPFTLPLPALSGSPSSGPSATVPEVLPQQYGQTDIIAPANGMWSEEVDARGERRKMSDGTFQFIHPDWIGKYHIEWGRYDRSTQVEGMSDNDPSKKFVIPNSKPTEGNTVKFRSANPTKEVRMFVVWVKGVMK